MRQNTSLLICLEAPARVTSAIEGLICLSLSSQGRIHYKFYFLFCYHTQSNRHQIGDIQSFSLTVPLSAHGKPHDGLGRDLLWTTSLDGFQDVVHNRLCNYRPMGVSVLGEELAHQQIGQTTLLKTAFYGISIRFHRNQAPLFISAGASVAESGSLRMR